MLNLQQRVILKDLRKKYGYDIAALPKFSIPMSDELMLETLLLLELDVEITASLNNIHNIMGERGDVIRMMLAVLAKSSGQLLGLYEKHSDAGDVNVLEMAYDQILNNARNEAKNAQ